MSKNTDDHIKRPQNSFIVFARHIRPLVKETKPKLSNRSVSKILGELWKALPDKHKSVFKRKAQDIAERHKEAYPSYSYNPQPKRQKVKCKARTSQTSRYVDIRPKGSPPKKTTPSVDFESYRNPTFRLVYAQHYQCPKNHPFRSRRSKPAHSRPNEQSTTHDDDHDMRTTFGSEATTKQDSQTPSDKPKNSTDRGRHTVADDPIGQKTTGSSSDESLVDPYSDFDNDGVDFENINAALDLIRKQLTSSEDYAGSTSSKGCVMLCLRTEGNDRQSQNASDQSQCQLLVNDDYSTNSNLRPHSNNNPDEVDPLKQLLDHL